MEEWDVLRDPKSDLSSAQVWEPIFAKLESGYYDVLILSPPCGTYSRARHRSLGKGGPVPLRSFTYPWGFPWLSNANRLKVDLANFFVKQCLRAISLQIQSSKFWLLEHPEDLGRTKSGEVPGSVWQLPELRELVLQGGTTWAIHQCMFEAATPKPTRLASNLLAFLPLPCSWPQFDPQRNYLGPLGTCPHGSHPPLVGFQNGRFLTSRCRSLSHSHVQVHCSGHCGVYERFMHRRGCCSAIGGKACALPPFLPFHTPSRGTCTSHPFSIQCFTRLLRERFPNQVFTSFGIFFNVLTSMHRDSRNAAFPNLLLALSNFTGGEVWHEEPGGQVLRSVQGTLKEGRLLDVAASPQVLQAHLHFHCTEPWSGDRVVLVGFSVDCTGLQPLRSASFWTWDSCWFRLLQKKGDLSEPHQSFPPFPPVPPSGSRRYR